MNPSAADSWGWQCLVIVVDEDPGSPGGFERNRLVAELTLQIAIGVMKKEPPKHRAAFAFWLRSATIPTGSKTYRCKVPLTTVSASVSMASISFPPSTTTKLKCISECPFGVMVALPLQSVPTL